MLNILPKGIIINNIVDTLKKDPENGIVKLLETAKSHSKTPENQALLTQVIGYYSTSAIAKMQIRSLVHNTSKRTLSIFVEKIYDALDASPPIVFNFMRMITIAEADKIKKEMTVFPVIDLKNLNDPAREVLAKLKNDGQIFFASIAVTVENFATVTSDDVILTLIKHGIRAIFYRMPQASPELETQLHSKINQIRTQRPILAFFMQKKDPHNSTSLTYVINENVNDFKYEVTLNLR